MRTAILTALVLLLCACAAPSGDAGDAASSRTPSAGSTVSDDAATTASPDSVTGVLGGDPDLEGGCAWLDTADGRRVEVVWPDGYRVVFDPVRLRDETGDVVAGEGDTITVRGSPEPDRVSVCQVGEIWTASTVEPAVAR